MAPTSAVRTLLRRRLRVVWRLRKLLVFFLAPLLFSPLPIASPTPEAKVAYMLLIMAVYWVTEALPIGVTALIPVVVAPLFKIIPSKLICPEYFSDSNMLFLGGLMLAISVEFWELHRRMALLVLQLVGVQPRWLLLGFMLPTWFMSMWISNTATAAMMLPIVDAVLQELMRYDQVKKELVAAAAAGKDGAGGGDGAVTCELLEKQPVTAEGAAAAAAADAEAGVGPAETRLQPEPAKPRAPLCTSVLEYIHRPENVEFRGACKMLTIAVAYSANYGGTPTLTGTPPNLVLNKNLLSNFGHKTPFNFGTWFLFAFPISIGCLFLAWIWLQILFLGPKSLCRRSTKSAEEAEAVGKALKSQYQKLGPITFPEVSCIVLFAATVLLWIGREPGGPGWGSLFTTHAPPGSKKPPTVYMSDAQPAVFMAVLLFVLPSSNPFTCCRRRRQPAAANADGDTAPAVAAVDADDNGAAAAAADDIAVVAEPDEQAAEPAAAKPARPNTLLTWQVVHERLPWGVVLLLGGGFALARATKESGLSTLIGDQLKPLGSLPRPLLVVLVTFCTTLITEITSNTATASILLPILVDLCRSIQLNPLSLMLPCTIAASLAFNLPVATPPNSIVFAKGYLTVVDMLKSGFMLTIVSGLVVVTATLTYGSVIFDLQTFPDWADAENTTMAFVSG